MAFMYEGSTATDASSLGRQRNLREKLKALAELQKVDLEIAALKKTADAYPKQLADLERELGAATNAVDAERARLTDLERQKGALEQSIHDEKDKVKKWEARLAEQRTSREYAALAREIDIAKKAIQTTQEEVAELARQLGTQREAVKAKEQELSARQDQIGGRMAELKQKMGELEGQFRALDEKRAGAAKAVDETLLRRYEQVRKKRLPALVPVLSPGICQGCNRSVTPQLYNTLRVTLGTDVCPACHRIIYAAEAMEEKAK